MRIIDAMGHLFGEGLRCWMCRVQWLTHQRDPKPCNGGGRPPGRVGKRREDMWEKRKGWTSPTT